MHVQKFGGALFGSSASIEALAAILRREAGGIAVISAFGGVTDGLIRAAKSAERREVCANDIEAMAEAHRAVARRFIDGAELANALGDIDASIAELRELLHGIELLRDLTPRVLDLVMSFGERLSAPLVAAVLRAGGIPARYRDARELLLTDNAFGQARSQDAESKRRVIEAFGSGQSGPSPCCPASSALRLMATPRPLGAAAPT